MNGTYHGPESLDIGHVRHVGSAEVVAMVAARIGQCEITDECAATIASWWTGPRRGGGLAMAELATSGRVMLEHLADDLSRAIDETRGKHGREGDRDALNMLATWALHHPSRAIRHADYPHRPGTMYDCLACEYGLCQCDETSAGCVSRDCTSEA